jgi:aspartate racemase
LPIINAISALEAELTQRGLRRVGLLGTRIVMASQLYGGLSGIEVVAPTGAHLETTHQEYIAMATAGYATEQQRDLFFAMGKDLCQNQGAEAVILAGTDLFLAFDDAKCGFPVIDSAQVHIDALYRASIQRASTEAQ